jgi:hypothetical protein
MAEFFSDHFASPSANTAVGLHYRAPVNISQARTRTKVARITGLFSTSDVVRMMSLRSSDRLLQLHVGSDAGSTAGTVHVGVYKPGENHDGAVEDVDLFDNALDISTAAIDPWGADAMVAGVLVGTDRGKTMWELVTLGNGPGNYTEDPNLGFDLCFTPSVSFTVADTELTMIATYTSGD